MGRTRSAIAAAIVVLLAIGAACRDGNDDEGPAAEDPAPSTAALAADPTVDDLAQAVGCDEAAPFAGDVPVGPIRSGEATDGLICTVDEVEVHLFLRSLSGPGPADEPDELRAIDRAVATGADGVCGSWLAVGDTWFALAADREDLEQVADALGGALREVLPTGPPASYQPPGCEAP